MTHNQSHSWLTKAAHACGKGLTAVGLLLGAGALTAGCLDRPVAPATPQTTNVYISQIRATGVDKIDLLFMIDNSISMADKQEILASAVPVLVQRLITPTCVDANGMPIGNGGVIANGPNGSCPNNQGVPEFKPIQDIHIGIVTSSLGDHGSNDICSDAQNTANGGTSFYNDLAQLLPSVRPASKLYSWNNTGFLVWDPRMPQSAVLDPHTPITMNETDSATFIQNFTTQVTAAGEQGCGYEASLEAWYRFLVDPEPVSSMANDGQVSARPKGSDGKAVVNSLVLQQRANFLRPDSLLAVVMMSDENDCSIVDEDGSQGWLVGWKGGVNQRQTFFMPRANSFCANPNDKCCRPCSSPAAANSGCADNSQDAACTADSHHWSLSQPEDSMNERCFNQVQRFGVDLLYPASRYVEGLSSRFVNPRGAGQVPNPIFAPGAKGEPPREAGLVFFAGLIGVPWQDIATPDSLQGRGLSYLTAQDLADQKRWDVILGDPDNAVQPTDPFMIESIDPRPTTASNPVINVAISPSSSAQLNPINGHEQEALPVRDDLQFACIFPLAKPVSPADCDANSDGCDCNADEFDKHSPLCQGVTAAAAGTQAYAKGYPGVRELQVLKGFGVNSIVASICPKNIQPGQGLTPATDAAYGYNPAVGAIVERLKEALTVKCLPRPLSPDLTGSDVATDANYNENFGKVPCSVVEVRPKVQSAPGVFTTCPDQDCSQPGRSTLTGERAKVVDAAKQFLANEGTCGGDAPNAVPCEDECFCELKQFTGMDLNTCETSPTDPGLDTLTGYCYVDPEAATASGNTQLATGEEALVKDCNPTQKRILRFMGNNIPSKDGLAFIACIGANAGE